MRDRAVVTIRRVARMLRDGRMRRQAINTIRIKAAITAAAMAHPTKGVTTGIRGQAITTRITRTAPFDVGIRFRRSIKILPDIPLNFGKRGVSTSIGVRGAHVTIGKTGTRKTVGLPGSGLSYSRLDRARHEATAAPPVAANEEMPMGNAWRGWLWIALLIVLVVVALSASVSCSNEEPPPQLARPPATSVSLAPTAAPAPDPRISYDLSEKCARDAREWFKHFYGDRNSSNREGTSMSAYSNHYNAKLKSGSLRMFADEPIWSCTVDSIEIIQSLALRPHPEGG